MKSVKKVKGIGFLPDGTLYLSAKKGKVDGYLKMGVPLDKIAQLMALRDKKYRVDNHFWHELLDLTKNSIEAIEIDELDILAINSTLHLQKDKLKPVQPSTGLVITLISGGDVYIKEDLLMEKEKFLQIEGEVLAELIPPNKMRFDKKMKKSKKDLDFNKSEYEEYTFFDAEFTPTIQGGQIIGSTCPVYKRDDEEKMVPVPSEDLVIKKIEEKLINSHPERFKEAGYNLESLKRKIEAEISNIARYGDVALANCFLESAPDVDLVAVYMDGRSEPEMIFYERSIVELDVNGEKRFLQTTPQLGAGLGVVRLDKIWFRKERKATKEKKEDLTYIG